MNFDNNRVGRGLVRIQEAHGREYGSGGVHQLACQVKWNHEIGRPENCGKVQRAPMFVPVAREHVKAMASGQETLSKPTRTRVSNAKM